MSGPGDDRRQILGCGVAPVLLKERMRCVSVLLVLLAGCAYSVDDETGGAHRVDGGRGDTVVDAPGTDSRPATDSGAAPDSGATSKGADTGSAADTTVDDTATDDTGVVEDTAPTDTGTAVTDTGTVGSGTCLSPYCKTDCSPGYLSCYVSCATKTPYKGCTHFGGVCTCL